MLHIPDLVSISEQISGKSDRVGIETVSAVSGYNIVGDTVHRSVPTLVPKAAMLDKENEGDKRSVIQVAAMSQSSCCGRLVF